VYSFLSFPLQQLRFNDDDLIQKAEKYISEVRKMASFRYRLEEDSLGKVKVPAGVYWGPETQRALENFPISGLVFPREFIRALGMIKMAAVEANRKLGLLPRVEGEAIEKAAWEVMAGKLDNHFPLDIFQTGSGTSTHMNANEIIAFRATRILGGGEKSIRTTMSIFVNPVMMLSPAASMSPRWKGSEKNCCRLWTNSKPP